MIDRKAAELEKRTQELLGLHEELARQLNKSHELIKVQAKTQRLTNLILESLQTKTDALDRRVSIIEATHKQSWGTLQ